MNRRDKLSESLRGMGFHERKIVDVFKAIEQCDNKWGSDKIVVSGHVDLIQDFVDGHRVVYDTGENTIVNLGITALATMWSLDYDDAAATFKSDAQNHVPYYIAGGLNNSVHAPPNGDTAVDPTDTLLNAEIAPRKLITSRTFSGSPVDAVILSMTLLTSEGNGNAYDEAGLFGADATSSIDTGTLLARKIFGGSLTKTVNFELTFKWTVTFSVP
jgi:hypothetical protein